MTITDYQKKCFSQYKSDIGYSANYKYFYGNPINVLVPVETPIKKVMIVGAYPSAKFFTVKGIADTPLYDNDSPFSNETYFDGSRTRTIPSGQELNEVILKNIGVEREDCWITDLVKVFLFKQGHIVRYIKLGKNDLTENRTMFNEFARRSISWLEEEIEIAKPYAVILLGLEVTSAICNTTDMESKKYFTGQYREIMIGAQPVNVIPLPHPGILMKRTEKNPWPSRFINEIAPVAKTTLMTLRKKANNK